MVEEKYSFIVKMDNEKILIKDNFGDINIFGDTYIMVKRCNINHVK